MNIFGPTKTTTPSRFNEDEKDVLTILKSQEKDLNSKIPEILRKELKIQSPSKLFGNYVATGDADLKQKASKSLQLMQDTVNEIPNQLSKQIGQPILRTYGGVASALTPGDFTPTGEFQQDLFGTDRPITLTSVGRENTFRNPEEESTGIFKVVDPAIGAFLGVADTLPALPAITRIAKESKALYDSLTPLERQAGKIKTIFSSETAPVFDGFKDLTTKILKDLEGKTTVSKQYILDATNRPELKQVERDLIRQALDGEGDKIDVAKFAEKVKAELLPLKTQELITDKNFRHGIGADGLPKQTPIYTPRYENIALPDELRGKVKNYKENIYQSPIQTSAGNTHFEGPASKNYFGHTRIEDMADNKTRRVIEVQSDLYQKGNPVDKLNDGYDYKYLAEMEADKKAGNSYSHSDYANLKAAKKKGEIGLEEAKSKLQQYNDPTAHFRMIREEIKKAAQDGKTKLQFPTGETAVKIEGLGQQENNFRLLYDDIETPAGLRPSGSSKLTPEKLDIGARISQGEGYENQWIITDVLGDGKFKAVPKLSTNKLLTQEQLNIMAETFDVSGKVDTNNPIYKFYEKDVQKYLNKFGGKKVIDDKGVSWVEIPITKEQGEMPVEAFGALAIPSILGESTKKEEPEMFGGDYWIRDNKITNADLDEASAILFGEISNRSSDKQLLEANTILNTAFNRMDEYATRGKPKTLTEVLQMDNQYQAYKGKQYNKFKKGDLDELDKRKVESIKKSIQKVKDGTFQNNIGKSVFYVHKPDGRIVADDRKLFKD